MLDDVRLKIHVEMKMKSKINIKTENKIQITKQIRDTDEH